MAKRWTGRKMAGLRCCFGWVQQMIAKFEIVESMPAQGHCTQSGAGARLKG